MMVLRSPLFVPGNNTRMIAKAATLAPDAIVFDLEDAVPLADKDTARVMIRDNMKPIKSSTGAYSFVRINGLTTGLTAEDLKFIAVEGLDGVLLPKAGARSDILELDSLLKAREKEEGLEIGSIKIIPLLETAKGVINAYEIASASPRLVAVGFGGGDYCLDMGISISVLSPEQTEFLYARSQTVIAGRAAGVQALDSAYFGLLTDMDRFIWEATMAYRLGFKGKFLIHPTQIDAANKVFSPSPEETEYSRRVVAAFEEAQAKGRGAVSLEGKMIDYMNYQQAKDIVNLVKFIAGREKKRDTGS